MENKEINKDIVKEMIIKFRTTYMDFDKFVEGKEEVLLTNWYEILNTAIEPYEIEFIPKAVNQICATKENMPSLAEIIKTIKFYNCPF